MDCSDNLISLSDSGVDQSLASSAASFRTCCESLEDIFGKFEQRTTECGITSKQGDCDDVGEFGLLVDLTDAIQVPQQMGIMLQAENDDTFGVFNAKSKISEELKTDTLALLEEEKEDDAAKLVLSFTSGRSDVIDARKGKHSLKGIDEHECDEDKLRTVDDSVESVGSDQPTVIEDDDDLQIPESIDVVCGKSFEDDEEGIMNTKMNLTGNSTLSGGSDSEILDPKNLSSFEICEDDDVQAFYNSVKNTDMASASAAKIADKIKLEVLQGEAEAEAKILNEDLASDKLLTDVTAQSFASTTASSRVNRMSVASVASSVGLSSTRMSLCSQKSNDLEPGLENHARSNRLSTASIASSIGFSSTRMSLCSQKSNDLETEKRPRARLSSVTFGSPIQTSYSVNRFFCPTPRAKTPSAAASSNRYEHRDRLSEALFSPSRTRVMLVTGDSTRSPSRVPVRKSISAETLHFEASPVRSNLRHSIKFSTPAANSKKARHSLSIQPAVPFPNIFGDDRPDCPKADTTLTDDGDTGTAKGNWEAPDFKQYRPGRLSYASTGSTASIYAASPAGSSIYSEDVSAVTSEINRMSVNPSKTYIHPVKATAVIAPTKPVKMMSEPDKTMTLPTRLPASGPGIGNRTQTMSPSTKAAPSPRRSAANQTTPSRSRYSMNVRSSGYGVPQNLSTSINGGKTPLESPNKTVGIKAPAINKILKPSVLSYGSKVGTKVGESLPRSGVSALKPPQKLMAPGSHGLPQPTTTSSRSTGNKENKLKLPVSSSRLASMSRTMKR